MEITLDFSSKYEELFAALAKVEADLVKIKTAAIAAQTATRTEIQKTVTTANDLGKALHLTAQGAISTGAAFQQLDSIQQATDNIGNLNQGLEQTNQQAGAIADTFQKIGDETSDSVSKSNQSIAEYTSKLDDAKQKWVDIIATLGQLSAEQKKELENAVETAISFDQMAKASGEATESNRVLSQILEGTSSTVKEVVQSFGELSPESAAALENVDALKESLLEIVDAAPTLTFEADTSEVVAAAQEWKGLGGIFAVEQKKATEAIKLTGAALDAAKQKFIANVNASKAINEEGKKFLASSIAAAQSMEELQKIADQLPEPIEQAELKTISLKQQINEAQKEAAIAVETYGRMSPQAQAAIEKTAELKSKLDEVNKAVNAADPGKKFLALGQVLQSVAGGFTAVQGALGFLNIESEQAEKALLKVQSALAITQGLNAFFSGFKDGYQNLISLVAKSTTVTTANTVATEANAVAQTTAAGATTVAAGAATTAAGAFRALTAAMIANPYLAVAAAVLAIGVAVATLGDDSEETSDRVKKLVDDLEDLASVSLDNLDFRKSLTDLRNQLDQINIGDDPKARMDAEKKAAAQTIAFLQQENEIKLGLLKDLSDQERAARDADDKSLLEDLKSRQKELLSEVNKNEQAKSLAILESEVNLANIRKDAAAQEKRDNDQRLAELKSNREELAAALKDLTNRSNEAITETADPRSQLAIQNQLALQSVEDLRATIIEKGRLVDKGFQLSIQQEQEFENIILNIQRKFYEESEALTLADTQTKLDLIADGAQKELAAFDLQFKQRAEKLKQAGATELQIELTRIRERNDLLQKFSFTEIDNEQTIQENLILSRERGAEQEKDFERRKQLDLLNLRAAFVQARLNLIAGENDDETVLLRSNLERQLAEIKAATGKLQGEINADNKKVDFFKLLGLDLTDEEKQAFKDSLNFLGQQVNAFKNALFESQLASLDLQKQANDAYIQQLNEQITATESALQEEQDMQDRGLANNADRRKKDLADLKKAKDEALRKDKEIAKEKAKIAKEQAVVDSLTQASSMGVAVAQLFARESLKGIPGIIAAGATAIGLLALFLSLKARFKASAATELEEGDQLDLKNHGTAKKKSGVVRGKSHKQGGHRIAGTNIYVEDKEWVINNKSSQKYNSILTGINNDRFIEIPGPVKLDFIERLLEGTNVVINNDEADKMVQSKTEYVNINTTTIQKQTINMKNMERLMKQQLDVSNDMKKDSRKPVITVHPDGTKEVTGPGFKTIIRP